MTPFINWQTAAILFAMVSVAVMPVMIAYFGWEGLKKMALVGKAYVAIFKVILVAFVIGFAGLVCWYEITTPPVERLAKRP